jgi:hypothetical protein
MMAAGNGGSADATRRRIGDDSGGGPPALFGRARRVLHKIQAAMAKYWPEAVIGQANF